MLKTLLLLAALARGRDPEPAGPTMSGPSATAMATNATRAATKAAATTGTTAAAAGSAFESLTAVARPSAIPCRTGLKPSVRMSRSISRVVAPKVTRTPTSRVRCVTICA